MYTSSRIVSWLSGVSPLHSGAVPETGRPLMLKKAWYVGAGTLVAVCLSASVEGAVIRIPESAFTPAAGLITFSEFPLNTINPTYTPAVYGGGAGAPTVTFDGFFAGQSM